MAKRRARSGSVLVQGTDAVFSDPNHHLAGPFTPQTPLGSNTSTPKRVTSPPRKKPRRKTLAQSLFGWAVNPAQSFCILCVPLLLYVNWEIVARWMPTSYSNPFHAFIFLSSPIPGTNQTRYAKTYKDMLFIAYYIVFWSFARETIVAGMKKLGRHYGLRKPAKLARFGEQGYGLVYWGWTGIYGVYIMAQLPTWWYRTEHFWIDYPYWQMIPSLKRYYLMQLAYWIQQAFVMILGLEKPRSDYKELVAHHLVTLWLIGGSYILNHTPFGNAVFISMDIPDAFFAFSKMLNYLQLDNAKVVSFAIFVFVWTYFRIYLNIVILWSVWSEFKLLPAWTQQWKPELGVWMPWWLQWQIFGPLFILLCLNLMWYYLILRIAWKAIMRTDITDDRSDDEGDAEEDEGEGEEVKKGLD